MAISRSLRRTNPVTLILATLLAVGFFLFIFSPNQPQQVVEFRGKHNQPATNPLSPPTAPLTKQSKSGRAKPPPVVHYRLNNVTTSAEPEKNQESVLILTPMARFYPQYWENLLGLTFPHHLISIAFVIPKTKEGNAATVALQNAIHRTQTGPENKRFASVTILRQDFESATGQDEAERHAMAAQKSRRAAMARARNSLVFTTLGPSTAWVLWLDADIVETPETLIQDLAAHNRPILVANAFQRFTNDQGQADVRPYDYNSWQDSEKAQEIARGMGAEDILLEGYGEMATYRTLMAKVSEKAEGGRNPNKIVPLDGVGGTALLVKAEVHRDGAMFPPFPFYHLIETEGFARMAKRLQWDSFGLPDYYVYHHNE